MDSFCFCGGDRRCRKAHPMMVSRITGKGTVRRQACHSSAEFSLAGSPPASHVIRWSVAREFHDARGRLSVAQHERSRAGPASSAESWSRRVQGTARSARRRFSARKSRSRCRTVRPCASHSSSRAGSPWPGLCLGLAQPAQESGGDLNRSCAVLADAAVTGPWRSPGDRGRRNSAAASRDLRIYLSGARRDRHVAPADRPPRSRGFDLPQRKGAGR